MKKNSFEDDLKDVEAELPRSDDEEENGAEDDINFETFLDILNQVEE